jgi:UDPglucose--hexose-1-phosphate uridylyltransferase
MNGIGAHEVIIESPDHNLSLATLPPKRIEDVLWAFRDRILDLKKDRRFKYILIFKNHGEAAGASLEIGFARRLRGGCDPVRIAGPAGRVTRHKEPDPEAEHDNEDEQAAHY